MGLNICDTSELPFKKMGHIPGHFTQNVVPSRSFIVISNPSIASQFKAQMSVSQGKIVKSKMAAEKAGSAAIHLVLPLSIWIAGSASFRLTKQKRLIYGPEKFKAYHTNFDKINKQANEFLSPQPQSICSHRQRHR